jgi:hypothetical protein
MESVLPGTLPLALFAFVFLLSVLSKAVNCGFLLWAKASKLDATWSAEKPLGHFMVCNESETYQGINAYLGHIKMYKQCCMLRF